MQISHNTKFFAIGGFVSYDGTMGHKRNAWLSKQKADTYYKKSKAENHRARSYYKLKQIEQKYHVLTVNGRFSRKVLDLGAAPGAWLEFIKDSYGRLPPQKRPPTPLYMGIDLNSIRPFADAPFVQTQRFDIFKPECENFIRSSAPWDVILSDLAPKTAGDFRDVAIQENMVQQVFSFLKYLRIGGNVALKIFQSENTDQIVHDWEQYFQFFKRMKPQASRSKSREMYLIGKGFTGLSS